MRGEFADLAPLPPVGRPCAMETGKRRRAAERTRTIGARSECIFDFEAFVDSVDFLEDDARNRMKLAGGELFDNLVRHALPLELGVIVTRITRHRSGLFLAFYFKSKAFARYAAGSAHGKVGPDAGLEVDLPASSEAPLCSLPLFDPIIGRWRGIGIHMCRYLSKSLLLRAGSRIDRIYIAF